jgi:hypothetical protein
VSSISGHIAGASYRAGEAGAQATAQSERIRPGSVANRFQAISQASMMSVRLGNTGQLRIQLSKVKSEPGPPMTLGGAAAARVRLIVWCKDCQHQVEPDPGEMAQRYGAATTVLDWSARLVCSCCGSRQVDMVVTGERR